ncbi:unnamed protein product [Prorocentrum cordatum]|uniref:Aquaporin n=1 Tax=Prorocentrum cordatum TaxID=2364126 RepID=A0ABN9UIM7_9DINO|nr:unnamed protein product [Polarella glacialis]
MARRSRAATLACPAPLAGVWAASHAFVAPGRRAAAAASAPEQAAGGAVPALRQSVAEFIAMALSVALTLGFATTVLADCTGAYSGGQINCAVTFGLVLAGQLSLAGSVVGALVLRAVYSDHSNDQTGGLGSNGVSEGFSKGSALLGEIVGAFVLMYVVIETAVNPMTEANRMVAPLAIGLAVFLWVLDQSHKVVRGTLKEMWIFWLGPLLGAALSVPAYFFMVQ